MPKEKPARILPEPLRKDWLGKGRLGRGGQAFVTEIENRTTGTRCALKCLRRSERYHRARLSREISVLKKLIHPNVVPLIQAADDASWYVMPKGVPLTEHWASRRQVCASAASLFEESLDIVRSVLSGLAAAHTAGFVHRDIKPANVLLIDGVTKVADFGIVHVPDEHRLTKEPAGNQFAPFIPSLYDPQHAPKAIDCFGAATLWAWMLAADPKIAYGHYHWRWHTFIEYDACEVTRAALALCGDAQYGPKDAQGFIRFIEQDIGLRRNSSTDVDGVALARVAAAQSIAKAKAIQGNVEEQALVASIAWSIRSFVDAVDAHCSHLASSMESQGAEIYLVRGTLPDRTGLIRPSSSLDELLAWAAARPGKNCPILTMSCRSDPSDLSMQIAFVANWHKSAHEDGSWISLGLVARHAIPELRRERYFKVAHGGLVLDEDWGRSIDVATVTAHIDAFLLNPTHHA
jgi:hypothetical protein